MNTRLGIATLTVFVIALGQAQVGYGEIFRFQDEILPPPPEPVTPGVSPSDIAPPPIPATPRAPSARSRYLPAYPRASYPRPWSVGKVSAKAAPRIVYRQHPLHRDPALACQPKHDVVVQVEDPIRCCLVDVPLCLPVCCDQATMQAGKGFLGRGVVCYDWACGVRVKIVFRHHGDVLVHYYGI